MAVKVLLKRYVPTEKETELLGLIKELRVMTTRQPGYITGETYRRIDNPGESLVISTWQSHADWNRWIATPERRMIQEKIDALLGKKTEFTVYRYF